MKRKMKQIGRRELVVLSMAAMYGSPRCVLATNYTISGGNTLWSDPNSWTPTGAPGNGNYATINSGFAWDFDYDYSGSPVTLHTVDVTNASTLYAGYSSNLTTVELAIG